MNELTLPERARAMRFVNTILDDPNHPGHKELADVLRCVLRIEEHKIVSDWRDRHPSNHNPLGDAS